MITAYRFGDYTLTASTRELRRGDTPIAISPRAFDCLAYLVAHRDRAVGKDELVAAIWESVDVSDTPFELSDKDIANIVVTFTDRISQLSGTVRQITTSSDVQDTAVIVFPGRARSQKLHRQRRQRRVEYRPDHRPRGRR